MLNFKEQGRKREDICPLRKKVIFFVGSIVFAFQRLPRKISHDIFSFCFVMLLLQRKSRFYIFFFFKKIFFLMHNIPTTVSLPLLLAVSPLNRLPLFPDLLLLVSLKTHTHNTTITTSTNSNISSNNKTKKQNRTK